MGRPRKAIRPVELSLSLPQDLADRLDLLLWSELENRVPHGAKSKFIEACIREKLASLSPIEGEVK